MDPARRVREKRAALEDLKNTAAEAGYHDSYDEDIDAAEQAVRVAEKNLAMHAAEPHLAFLTRIEDLPRNLLDELGKNPVLLQHALGVLADLERRVQSVRKLVQLQLSR